MTQWFVKDLSKLTGVSVQTLHHYDRIGLLKPSLRLINGYRVYSEKDLLKLQQIIALKFFGFELSRINAILQLESDALEHFNIQAKVLEQKAAAMAEGAKALRHILASVDNNQSIPWETIIQLIEVYKMTQHLEHAWVKEIFTPEELKQYAEFEIEMKAKHNKETFEKRWDQLLNEIKKHVHEAPDSATGIELGGRFMAWVNSVYGKKYAHLRTKKWEKGFGEGKGLDDIGMSQDMMIWLEKAVDAYWEDRIYNILSQVGKMPSSSVEARWREALDELYGNETSRKDAVVNEVLHDNKVSEEAKKWLKQLK